MPCIRHSTLLGKKHIEQWAQEFDAIEKKLKMGQRTLSTVDNIKKGTNCGKPNGVENNHILPLTFGKNYYRPATHVYRRLAGASGGWTGVSIDEISSRQNYYTVTSEMGSDNITLERFFKKIEDHVPEWLKDGGISAHQRGEPEYWMSWFIATQLLRTPGAAEAQRLTNKTRIPDTATGVHIAGNLFAAHCTARNIFSWHWKAWKLNSYQTDEEVLLGESCVYQYHGGVVCNIKKHTALTCTPTIETPSETIEHCSKADELEMIRELNRLTIETNAKYGGYIYGSKPIDE